jgi:L-arabonate dehydrase
MRQSRGAASLIRGCASASPCSAWGRPFGQTGFLRFADLQRRLTSSSSKETQSNKRRLRSQDWFGKKDRDGFAHRSWMKNQGLPDHVFDGRPVIGICNTWSELTPCNAHFRRIAESVKKGVWEMGGFPLEFPVMSLGETLLRPTAMLFRNLASMDVEESIRANPIDGVVLLTGCDKTTPSLVMGAASVDLPTIVVPGGPMLNGRWRDQTIGSGTHVWKFDAMVRSGELSLRDFMDAESCMSRSAGHCMTMGTASTMACMVEALGLTLPGAAAIPAVDSRKYALAHLSGRRIVEMVHEDLRLSKVLKRKAFENAIRVNGAIGGSTNAVIHLLAMARRVKGCGLGRQPKSINNNNIESSAERAEIFEASEEHVPIVLDDWDRLGRNIPCLVNLMPSGKYLMEDFYYAGGLQTVMHQLAYGGKGSPLLHLDALTVNGQTVENNIKDAKCWNEDVITPLHRPFKEQGGIIVVKGNLAPNGAVLKPSAASPHLLKHKGKAVVFEDIEDCRRRTDDPALEIDENSIMVLKNCGPRGYPGMAEVGNMPLPSKLLKRGITDLVRISDARMSGTAYGTVVLHTSPEAAVGGPLALVKTGDLIELDALQRRLHLHVSDEELARRKAAWRPPKVPVEQTRGYSRLYVDNVLQADQGCDLDFLVGCSGDYVGRESH